MDHEALVQAARDAINAVFSDRSVSASQTRDSLEDIAGEIEILTETLPRE